MKPRAIPRERTGADPALLVLVLLAMASFAGGCAVGVLLGQRRPAPALRVECVPSPGATP